MPTPMDEHDAGVPGALDVRTALRHDPLYRLLRGALTNPFVLGATLALLALVAVVFGPSSDSRFIYTDF